MLEKYQNHFFLQAPQPIIPMMPLEQSNSSDEKIFDDDFDFLDDKEIISLVESKPTAVLPSLDQNQDLAKNIVDALDKKMIKISNILKGMVENYKSPELGLGIVSLYNEEPNNASLIDEKIIQAINEGKIVLAIVEVEKKSVNEFLLNFKIAKSLSANFTDIEQMKGVIAMNIMMANVHMDPRNGIGSFKAVWKQGFSV